MLPLSETPPDADIASSMLMGLAITTIPGLMTSPSTPIFALFAVSSDTLTLGSTMYWLNSMVIFSVILGTVSPATSTSPSKG